MKDCEYCGHLIDYHDIIDCITCALDAKDPYTAGHSERVSDMALQVCELIGLKEDVLYHHERFDGKGYPDGLIGEQIPLGARIIAICDSIDAITSNRCYRLAHDFEYCYGEIERNLGIMYDPMIGKYVLEHWKEVTSVVIKDHADMA